MKVTELTADQLEQLKQAYIIELFARLGKTPSWLFLASAGAVVSNTAIYNRFAGVSFVENDFTN